MKFKHVVVIGMLIALLIAPVSALAQEPGSGGPVIEGNFSGSPSIGSFLQLRCSGTDCDRIADLLYPNGLIGVDHENGVFAGVTHELDQLVPVMLPEFDVVDYFQVVISAHLVGGLVGENDDARLLGFFKDWFQGLGVIGDHGDGL